MLGTGISPGFVELVAMTLANLCDRVDKVTVDEASDTTLYDSPTTEQPASTTARAIEPPMWPSPSTAALIPPATGGRRRAP